MPKKQKSGLYRAKVKLNDGTYKYLSAKSIADLNAKKAEVMHATMKGNLTDDRGYTVGEWADMWLDIYKSSKSPKTYSGYRNIVKNHITIIRNIRLKNLTAIEIQQCINKLDGHWDLQDKLRKTIRQILEAAIDNGLIYQNVARKVTLPAKPDVKRRALTAAERVAIPKAPLTLKERTFVYLMWYAGLRPEEVRALTINDINLDKKLINVNKAITFASNNAVLKETKTKSGNRSVGILKPLESILRQYLSEVDNLYLFTTKSGSMMTQTSYRRLWQSIYKKINTEMGGNIDIKATDLTPYNFRREYATILYYSDVDVKEAARLMGHKDTRLILDIYASLDVDRSSSTSKLNKFLENY